MAYPPKFDYRLRVGKTVGTLQAPSAHTTFIVGPYANAAVDRQHLEAHHTRMSVNANIKPVLHGTSNAANRPVSLAGTRTRLSTPLTGTGTLGKPVSATQSLMTGKSN